MDDRLAGGPLPEIKMVLCDLDGTLLNGESRLSAYTAETLALADRRGVLVVPATGRPLSTLPRELLGQPFLKYAVLMNGAQAYDCAARRAVYERALPLADADRILRRLEDFPVLRECFAADGRVYLEARHYSQLERWVPVPAIREIMRRSRTVAPDLRREMGALGRGVWKIHVYTGDNGLRDALMPRLAEEFPCASVSCSVPGNIEITHREATKGAAMKALCASLSIPLSHVMAFGDERNDRAMLEYAGVGVAMGNALEELKGVADRIAPPNTEDGVARVIREAVLGLGTGAGEA